MRQANANTWPTVSTFISFISFLLRCGPSVKALTPVASVQLMSPEVVIFSFSFIRDGLMSIRWHNSLTFLFLFWPFHIKWAREREIRKDQRIVKEWINCG